MLPVRFYVVVNMIYARHVMQTVFTCRINYNCPVQHQNRIASWAIRFCRGYTVTILEDSIRISEALDAWLYAHMSVCLSVCLSRSVCLSVIVFLRLCFFYLSLFLYFCCPRFLFLSVYLCLSPSSSVSISLSIASVSLSLLCQGRLPVWFWRKQ